jgi:hypothetical protein
LPCLENVHSDIYLRLLFVYFYLKTESPVDYWNLSSDAAGSDDGAHASFSAPSGFPTTKKRKIEWTPAPGSETFAVLVGLYELRHSAPPQLYISRTHLYVIASKYCKNDVKGRYSLQNALLTLINRNLLDLTLPNKLYGLTEKGYAFAKELHAKSIDSTCVPNASPQSLKLFPQTKGGAITTNPNPLVANERIGVSCPHRTQSLPTASRSNTTLPQVLDAEEQLRRSGRPLGISASQSKTLPDGISNVHAQQNVKVHELGPFGLDLPGTCYDGTVCLIIPV